MREAYWKCEACDLFTYVWTEIERPEGYTCKHCAERDELQRRLSQILDRLPEGGVWCYACNRATVPIWGEEPYEHIDPKYKQMKTTFRCSICKRDTHAKDSCVDTLRAILNPEGE